MQFLYYYARSTLERSLAALRPGNVNVMYSLFGSTT